LLSQKGFENIFFLSGGIEDFVSKFPEWCEGTGVQEIINEKIQMEIKNREGTIKFFNFSAINKSTKGKFTSNNNNNSIRGGETKSTISMTSRNSTVLNQGKSTITSNMNANTTTNQTIKNMTNLSLKK